MKPGFWQAMLCITRAPAAAADAATGTLQMRRMCVGVSAGLIIVPHRCSEIPSLASCCSSRRDRYSRVGFGFLSKAEDDDVLPDPSLVDDRWR